MVPKSPERKRKATGAPVSPPISKRRLQSGTTKSAVQSFFTPTSQKPKDRTRWTERRATKDKPATLLVGHYEPESSDARRTPRRKIAAFDLDSTLIITASGKKHPSSATDWQWWHNTVPSRLRQLHEEEEYQVVILSNQAGITLHVDPKSKAPKAATQKRLGEFKQKCSAILTALDLPTSIYAATERDQFRKPRTGMWNEFCEDYEIPPATIDLENSIFVGDAGGRVASLAKANGTVAAVARDFSCSDRNLAHNLNIRFQTPEEFFLGEQPRDFVRDFDLAKYPYVDSHSLVPTNAPFNKANPQDIVLFCGPPGAGKSTFYWVQLEPLGYKRVNQDTLKTRDKCVQAARQYLDDRESIVIDNTNADPETRGSWVELANKFGIPIRCIWFKTPLAVSEHNDAVRSQNPSMNRESRLGLPKMAFTGFTSRYKEPQLKEGFQDLTEVEFAFRGSKEEYGVWARYWI